MVVAGINSSGGAWDSPTVGIDVKALGYYRDEGEIRYFSYAADGGAYTKADTLGDLDLAAQHLLAAAACDATRGARAGKSISSGTRRAVS